MDGQWRRSTKWGSQREDNTADIKSYNQRKKTLTVRTRLADG